MDFALISYHPNKFENILCHFEGFLHCNDLIKMTVMSSLIMCPCHYS
jgi:hypothetical protein